MPQLHLYVSDATAERIKRLAESHGLAVSRYLADVVVRDLGEAWPEGYFEAVVGGWQGEPLIRDDQGPSARSLSTIAVPRSMASSAPTSSGSAGRSAPTTS